MGLKKLGLSTRGLLAEGEDHERTSDDDDVVVVGKPDANGKMNKSKRRGRGSFGASKILGREELKRQTSEIVKDKENLHVRKVRPLSESLVLSLT
jgi:division protein 1